MGHLPHATTLALVVGATADEGRRWDTAITVAAVALLVVGIPAVVVAYRRWTR